jgi:surfeit locus 1 family protein
MLRRYLPPLLFGLIGCAILISLGLWQLQRLAWKEALLDGISARLNDTPVALPAAPDPAVDQYLPVTVTGRFTGAGIDVLAGLKGRGPGYRIVAAFQTADGRAILVDRGFLPESQRAAPRQATTVTITGTLHWPNESDSFTPAPDTARNIWFARDVPAMARALGTGPVMVVARSDTGDGIMPVPVDTAGIPNDHLNYALTWFGLAVVWAGMTGLLLWRIRRRTI